MTSPEFERIDVRRFRCGVNFGKTLLDHSWLSDDEMTQSGLGNIAQLLTESGAVILDSHRTRTDIFCVGAQLVNNLDINKGVVPYAEYLDTKRAYHFLFQIIRKKLGDRIELFRVVRKEIRDHERPDIQINLTEEKMNSLNQEYEERVVSIPHEVGTILFAAAYGSRKKYRQKEKIRRVSIDVLKHGCPLVCTYGVKVSSPKRQIVGPYEVLVSDHVLRFASDATKEQVRDTIDAEYDYLERKAQEKYPLEGVKLFIFDWSGTISDDRAPVYEANMRVFDENGISRISFEEWLAGSKTSASELFTANGIQGTPKELFDLYRQTFDKVVSEGIKPRVYPKIEKVLKALKKRKLPIIVISAHPETNLTNEAKEYGLSGFINRLIGGVTDKRSAIFQICEEYGIDPKNVAYIGDTTFDMIAARGVGTRAVAVEGGYHLREKLEAESPNLILNSLRDLLNYIY